MFLPIGFLVGWLVRGRRSAVELSGLRMLQIESQFQDEEASTAFDANDKELEPATVELEQKLNSQQRNNSQSFSDRALQTHSSAVRCAKAENGSSKSELSNTATNESTRLLEKQLQQAIGFQAENTTRVASLTSHLKQQQATIKQQKDEQLKLKKSVVSMHKKYLQCNTATRLLHSKVATALELTEEQGETKSADELANAVRKLHIQWRNSEQLQNDYERINTQNVASSTRIVELESSLEEYTGLKIELEAAKQEVHSLQVIEKSAQQQKADLFESQNQNKQLQQQANQLKATIEELEKSKVELEAKSRHHRSLQQKLDESRINYDNVVEKLQTSLHEQQQYIQTIEGLQNTLSLAESDQERIAELEKDLQSAKTTGQASAEKHHSLLGSVQDLKQVRDSLLAEKSQWQIGTSQQESTISGLEKRNQDYINQLGDLRKVLATRDETIAKIRDNSAFLENKAKQLQSKHESQQASEKKHSNKQKDQIACLTDKLNTSASELELLTRNLKRLEPLPSEIEVLQTEKSALIEKLEISVLENQNLLNTHELTETELNEQIRHSGSIEAENVTLKKSLERSQTDSSILLKLQTTHAESEKKLNAAILEVSRLQAKLKENMQLEENLHSRERDIAELRNKQALTQSHGQTLKRELDRARASLTRSNAALSERTAESNRLSRKLGDQVKLKQRLDEQNLRIQEMQNEISAFKVKSAAQADLEEKLKSAKAEITKQQAQLKYKTQLEQTLQEKEREIAGLHSKQAHIDDLQREHDKVKSYLAQSEAAVAESNAESKRLMAKLNVWQKVQGELEEQKKITNELQKRTAAFDKLKYELTVSKEAHEQLRKTTPDIEVLQKRIRKIERKNRVLLSESESIPKLEKKLAKVRLRNRELNATQKSIDVELDSLKKENASNKRRASRLYRQLNPSGSVTVHKKLVRNEIKKTLSSKKAKTKKSKAKKSVSASKVVVTAAKKKQPARKSMAAKSSNRSITRKTGRKTYKSARSDDLKKIHGIGPVLEKRLHRNGITRFEQLAKLDRKGIAALSEKLGSSSYRIKNDAWVKSASMLAKNRGA